MRYVGKPHVQFERRTEASVQTRLLRPDKDETNTAAAVLMAYRRTIGLQQEDTICELPVTRPQCDVGRSSACQVLWIDSRLITSFAWACPVDRYRIASGTS